ncbi:MAG: IPTL-CTERM sorting domain-containing protein [Bacteroidetes bacterium]|nr:IPTL-CTERM sorting domain-containing protein [Bacteroidota bacterium]
MKKNTILSFVIIAIITTTIFSTNAVKAQITIYTATLSGLNELPPNPSAGTGTAIITINQSAATMRVQCSFSGLTGQVTASHIHAATPAPYSGNAGVATTTPSFPGFPTGVTSGSYDNTFDMTLATSYNPSFITAHGGTTATAFAFLLASLNSGQAYYNIHTTVYPGGEIRGFLVHQPSIPTLSQWGLIIFGLMMLSVGMLYIYRRKRIMI